LAVRAYTHVGILRPLVVNGTTVVVPCLNAGSYLEKCISSIGEQQEGRFELLEVLVVDDGSTESTTLAALERISRNPLVRVLRNERQNGSAGARNTGVRHARGEWIAFLDADDWWPRNSLYERFDALAVHPEATWVGGDFGDVTSEDDLPEVGRFESRLASYPFLAAAYHPIKRPLLLDSPLNQFLAHAPTWTGVTLLRRDVISSRGGFAEHLLRAQDFHLWLRLSAQVPFLFVPQVLAFYRHHATNSTKSTSHTLQWRGRALEDLLDRDSMRHVRSHLAHHLSATSLALSYEYRRERESSLAALAALRAIRHRPRSLPAWKSLIASVCGRD